MATFTTIRSIDGKAVISGLHDQPDGQVVARSGDIIVAKHPGYQWYGTEGNRGYARAETVVYRVDTFRPAGLVASVHVEDICRIDARSDALTYDRLIEGLEGESHVTTIYR